MMRSIICLVALLIGLGMTAQVDSTARAVEATWMQPRTDGRLWHDLPPPANVVNAGFALEYAGHVKRDARWLRAAGTTIGAVLYTQNPVVGMVVAGASWLYGEVLGFRASKAEAEAGMLLKLGYSVHERYDLVPDSLDDGQREMLVPRRYR
jgi:hypothetical protein